MVTSRPISGDISCHSPTTLTRPVPKQGTRHLVNNASSRHSSQHSHIPQTQRKKNNTQPCPLGRQSEAVRVAVAAAYRFSTFDRSSGCILEPVSLVLSEKEYTHFITFIASSTLSDTRRYSCNYDCTSGELYIEMPTPTHETNTSLCKNKINEGIIRQFDKFRELVNNLTDDEFETLKLVLQPTSSNGTADVELAMRQSHTQRVKGLLGPKCKFPTF